MSDWNTIVEQIAEQVVRIQTASEWGTGFVHYARDGGTRCIATARHVVEAAVRERQTIRIWHGMKVSVFGQGNDAIFVQRTDADVDSALLVVIEHALPKPLVPVINAEERAEVVVGMEVGWLGFPALNSLNDRLCFFSGRISLVDRDAHRYLIDGTGVQGCSGGPVFCQTAGGPRIIGALIQHIPNVNLDDHNLLPGLSAAVDVSNYKSVEEALDKLPQRQQRRLTIKLDECPKCGAGLSEATRTDGTAQDLVCAAGCGSLVDLLDREFVNGFPGGPIRLNEIIRRAFKRVSHHP